MKEQKCCSGCKQLKNLDEFPKRKGTKDGRKAKCKICVKAAHKPETIEARRAYDRQRKQPRPDKAQRYRENNKKKIKVHREVTKALREGILKKDSCEVCGSFKTHAHHDDYNLALNVRWLCSVHHQEWHLINGAGKNGSDDEQINLQEDSRCLKCEVDVDD